MAGDIMKTSNVQKSRNTDDTKSVVESSMAAETSGITNTVIATRAATPIATNPINLN